MLDKRIELDLGKAVKERIKAHFNNNYQGVSRLSFERYLNDTLSLRRAEDEISLIKKKLPIDIKGKRLLEIGSGFCAFIVNSVINHRVISFGAEPNAVCYAVSQELLSSLGISPSIIKNDPGENLSYPDDSFDIVYSSNVLEHVQNPEKVFSEAIRVLRPGGYLFFIIPNYGSWWDGHYGIIWLPNLPRSLAKVYVRILGRDPKFIDHLKLITLKQIENIVQNFSNQLEILDWGWDVWEYRLASLDFSGWADLDKLKKILYFFHRWRLVKLIALFGRRFGWITPIILIGEKKG